MKLDDTCDVKKLLSGMAKTDRQMSEKLGPALGLHKVVKRRIGKSTAWYVIQHSAVARAYKKERACNLHRW